MSATEAKIVTVWLDETSDATEPRWIVDTDIPGGGESTTLKEFDDRDDACNYATKYAAEHGLRVEYRD